MPDDKGENSSLAKVIEKDLIIKSQQHSLETLSKDFEVLQKLLEQKDASIISQQKELNEISDWASTLQNDLGNTRDYFNQIWREYSAMRNKLHQLRMNRWVGWFVNWEYYLSPGEKLLKNLVHEQPKDSSKDSSEHFHFQQLGNEDGTYNGAPHTVILDVTAQCNLQCVMCFQSSMKKRDFVFGELSDKSIRNSARFIAKAYEVKLFATGEPFLSPGLRDMIDILYGNVSKLVISTNGTIYNNNISYIMNRLTTLTVSVDSASEEVFERIRKNAKFTHIIKNVKRMRHDHPNLFMTFAVTVARYNLDECPKIVQLAADLKINHVQFSTMRSLEPGMDKEELCDADREWIEHVGLSVKQAARDESLTVEWQV